MAMSVVAEMVVMQATFEAEIAEVCGPKGKHDPDRAAVRHGSGRGSVTLGGRRVAVDWPRAHTLDGREVPLTSYGHFASEGMLTQLVMERMLAGVATRRHARTAEPAGMQVVEQAKSTNRSAISRRFVRQTETALAELMARDLTGEDIKVLMIDGEHTAERCVVAALAITADGTRSPSATARQARFWWTAVFADDGKRFSDVMRRVAGFYLISLPRYRGSVCEREEGHGDWRAGPRFSNGDTAQC